MNAQAARSRDCSAIPQLPALPVVGNVPDLDVDTPVQSMMGIADQLGPIFRLQLPTRSPLIVSSRELVDQLEDEERFEKMIYGPLEHIRDFAGDGLFTARSDEENWGKAHRILMPAFGQVALRDYFDPMVDIADQMLTKWERLGSDTRIDVADNMTRLTLDTIALCGFDFRFNSFYQREMHPFVESMVRALDEAGSRARRLPLQNRLMLGTRRQYRGDIEYMNEVVDEVIEERRQNPEADAKNDLLGRMLAARDPQTGDRLDDVNIRYQILTFLIAGHETTSGLLSFTTYQLLKHPEVMERARREADRVLGEGPPRFEHLSDLNYIEQVLRESLRLWPTAPAYSVYPHDDTVLESAGERYAVEAEEQIMVLLPKLHRDPSVWSGDVERFDPQRFAPERVEQRPSNAWKPFGRGKRACIGRPFAMQEAKLVVAMMLRRFELIGGEDYDLEVKETLTLKPDGLRIRAKRRDAIAKFQTSGATVTDAGGAEPSSEGESEAAGSSAHDTPLLVLYGSNSGSSEAFARRIATDGGARGWASELAPMDDHVADLPEEGAVVVVTASYNGHPPDNAVEFCDWLDTLEGGALEDVDFAVFGCGNRDWAETYQQVPRRVDNAFEAAGATRLLERGEADARGDFFGDFEAWYEPVWPELEAAFGVEGEAEPADEGPLYEVERIEADADPLVDAHGTRLATVVENRQLVDMSASHARSKRHLELDLPEAIDYEVGDYLVVLPENPPAQVERAASRFGLKLDEMVRLSSRADTASLPTDRPMRVDELLGRYVELGAPATRRDIARLAELTPCPPEQRRLERWAEDADAYREEILDCTVSLLELVEKMGSCTIGFDAFLDMLPPMRPRQYSISSAPGDDPSRCTLTVSVVDGPARSGEGRYRGTCSTHLARARPGDRLEVSLRQPNQPFRPPTLCDASPEDPMVMVCAGSGLAPFRGFIQHRAALREAGREVGPMLLFFGCDHPDVDFLYRDELEGFRDEALLELYPAFSEHAEQPDNDVRFVQHRLWAERDRVAELFDKSPHFYVCGDGEHMAPAARQTLVRIRREQVSSAQDGDGDAEQWLESLEEDGRYVADVFS